MQDIVERVASARQQCAAGGNMFRRDADVWTLSFVGRTVIVPDAKGLRDIHMLLMHVGQDVSVMTLARTDGLAVALRGPTGLGGRARRFSNDAERARKAVRARIRDTLRHLDARHPELASHLGECISTGSTCCHQPKQKTVWILR